MTTFRTVSKRFGMGFGTARKRFENGSKRFENFGTVRNLFFKPFPKRFGTVRNGSEKVLERFETDLMKL